MGVFVSQHGQLGAIPPPPFLSVSPWRSYEVEVRYPPPKRGISAVLARYPMKTRQNACDTPLCDTISKRYCVIGGVSRTGPLSVGPNYSKTCSPELCAPSPNDHERKRHINKFFWPVTLPVSSQVARGRKRRSVGFSNLNRRFEASGSEKRCLLEKGSFQKCPMSRDSEDIRESRDSRDPPP